MRRVDILNALVAMGYTAEGTETIKNGVIMEGIVILDSDPVAPIVYTQKLIEQAEMDGKSVSEVVAEILNFYEEKRNPGFDITCLYQSDFVREHVYVGVQKKSDEEILKRDSELEGLELYLYIRMQRGEDYGIVKLNPGVMRGVDIPVEELWTLAEQNICSETTIRSLSEVLGFGVGEDPMGLTVLSNRSGVRGAAAIIDKEVIREYAERKGVERVIILPSSIHEVLLLPDYGNFDICELNNMVEMVNLEQVAPEERLTDRAYMVEV